MRDSVALWLNRHPDAGERIAQFAIANAQERVKAAQRVVRKRIARNGMRIAAGEGAVAASQYHRRAFLPEGLVRGAGRGLADRRGGRRRDRGKQVLDFCAGGRRQDAGAGGGDGEHRPDLRLRRRPRRLADIVRLAGPARRNLQVRSPIGPGAGRSGRQDGPGVVDAPCTGTGTWRRHPDTKWRLTPKSSNAGSPSRTRCLPRRRAFVKPGGAAVYVTCSLLPEENDQQAVRDYEENPNSPLCRQHQWARCSARPATPLSKDAATMTLSPATTDTDGFFFCRWNERSEAGLDLRIYFPEGILNYTV